MILKRLSALVTTFVLFAGCRTSEPAASETKHVFGETVHPTKNVTSCRWDKDISIHAEVDLYLAAVAQTIATANPKTFTTPFEIQNICIYVQEDDNLNATAIRNLNTIFVNSGLVQAAKNDAEIASTLAHELAHLTMQSVHGEDVPPEVLRSPTWPKMRDRFEFESQSIRDQMVPLQKNCNTTQTDMQKISLELAATLPDAVVAEGARLQSLHLQLSQFDSTQYIDLQIPRMLPDKEISAPAALTPEDAALAAARFKRDRNAFLARLRSTHNQLELKWEEKFKAFLTAYQKIQTLHEQLAAFQKEYDQYISDLAGPGAKYSWQEQQADEVGYELYLRTGFDPIYMPWLERENMGEIAYQKCLKEHVERGVAPIRSDSAHPADCWRVYDFLYLEARYHADDYKSFYSAPHTANMPELTGRLETAKKAWKP